MSEHYKYAYSKWMRDLIDTLKFKPIRVLVATTVFLVAIIAFFVVHVFWHLYLGIVEFYQVVGMELFKFPYDVWHWNELPDHSSATLGRDASKYNEECLEDIENGK